MRFCRESLANQDKNKPSLLRSSLASSMILILSIIGFNLGSLSCNPYVLRTESNFPMDASFLFGILNSSKIKSSGVCWSRAKAFESPSAVNWRMSTRLDFRFKILLYCSTKNCRTMISLRSSLFSFLLFFIALNEPNFQLFVKGEKPPKNLKINGFFIGVSAFFYYSTLSAIYHWNHKKSYDSCIVAPQK